MENIIAWVKEHLKIVGLVILTVIILVWQFWPQPSVQNNNAVNFEEPKKKHKSLESTSSTSKWIMVDVQGAVNKPGVYRLLTTARVYDAIQHAGGVTDKADLHTINQAQKLHDQAQIYVNEKGEAATTNNVSTSNNQKSNGSINPGTQQINLNTADATQLQNLTGIGPKKAELIVQYRQEHGNFNKIEDLAQVQGIGDKTVEKLKSQLTV
ncbi:helix-hairpin-helix domain-containing protein [Bombilactobacillus bombi]|uniref:helix-hairpin-helix domain-containing protein n=1 Tax=Bombilactobacillus bombi TaxID=1303590 RepID=UPI0015E5FBFC|nr:helix-hairpin-helix domain-containing protein [Bombilactobacillus bombi]MBA1435278.1 hypothetical protein [Bombilactobacillus bombi]